MFTFYIMCLVLIILETNAENHLVSDNPLIVFIYNESQDYKVRRRNVIKYTVVKEKSLNITLKNFQPISAECTNFYEPPYTMFFSKVYNTSELDVNISVENITDEMSTKWKCTVRTHWTNGTHNLIFDVFFNIHVKGAKKVSFIVNNRSLKPNISDQRTAKYDGEKVYEYLDGELILLTCKTAEGDKRLKYYDSQGFLLFRTDQMNSTEWFIFRSVLTARNDYFYIECEHYSINPSETYYYRLIFVLKKPVPKYVDEINLSVNGLTLVPRISNTNGIKYYNYYYEYGFENTLNVTCQNNTIESSLMGLDINSNAGTYKTSNIIETKLNLNNTMLPCECTNIDTSIASARLQLESGIVASATRILGLPEKNLEYQYTKNRSFYSMKYKYSPNEAVQLTCVTNCANVEKIVWNYKNKNTTAFKTSATLQFTFTAEHNATSIQCDIWDNYGVKNYTVDVFLNLDPDNEVSVNLITDVNQPFVIIGAAIAVMVVIITVICALCWFARTRKKINENNYENLSNNSIIPASQSQCENNYEDPATVFPSLRQSGTPSDGHYTEIDIFFNNPIYTNNQGCELTLNDAGYDLLQHSSNNEINCRINSTNSVAFRKEIIDIEIRNRSGTNISKVTYKNNSLYNSG